MASSPDDHVKDIPYFAIGEDGSFLFPKIEKEGHSVSVDWGGGIGIKGAPDSPWFFTVHSFSLAFVSLLLILSAIKAVRDISARPVQGRGTLSQLFEVLVQFIRNDVCKPNLGPHGSHYVPLMLTFFFIILFCNLWGLVPLLFTATATSNINITAGLALTVLFLLFYLGMKEQGVWPFWKNLIPSGVPILLLPIIYPIEFIGPFAKCFALCMRLFANMVGGHIVLASLIGMSFGADGGLSFSVIPSFLMAVAISGLEVFVAVLQAYIFTLLTSVFLGSFIHPDH